MLYVRQKTMPTIPRKRHWKFRTKLELAARLVEWLAELVKKAGKTLWVVVDGGYTKSPFLKRALAVGVVVEGRLRKDAALRGLPPAARPSKYPPESSSRILVPEKPWKPHDFSGFSSVHAQNLPTNSVEEAFFRKKHSYGSGNWKSTILLTKYNGPCEVHMSSPY
jgi:hypothetical protein